MKKQLKILSLIDVPWNSGLTDYAIKQAKALEKTGYEVFFGATERTLCLERIKKEGFTAIYISDRKKLNLLGDILKIRNFAKKRKIDILNAHTGRTQTIAILSATRTNLKIIRTKADAKTPRISLLSGRISKIICASAYIQQMYTRRGISENKVEIIPPPAPKMDIPLPGFKPPIIIGILARLDPVKGHRYFLDAAALLTSRNEKVEFEIGGYEANTKYPELKKYADKLGIVNKVHFYGEVKQPEDFIKRCDIGIITSTGSEAVSRVLLEWLSAGRPVISTNVKTFSAPPEDRT